MDLQDEESSRRSVRPIGCCFHNQSSSSSFSSSSRYVNIGRSHDHCIYPLHIDLNDASRNNIVSRLHCSVRFDLDQETWTVQIFGRQERKRKRRKKEQERRVFADGWVRRNGVELPSQGWVLPADSDDDVWKTLRSYHQ